MFRAARRKRVIGSLLAATIGLLSSTNSLANPVDYDGLVLGADLLRFEGGEWSGLLDLDPRSSYPIPDVAPAFPPNGLRFGPLGEFQGRLGYALAGAVVLAASSFADTDEAWGRGQGNPRTRDREQYFPEDEGEPPTYTVALWQVFASSSIDFAGFNYDGINHWRLLPEVVDEDTAEIIRRGQLVLTWENIPASDQRGQDPRRNSFQMIMTHVGDGDADIELRFARCEWHSDVRNSYFVVSGFHTGIVRWINANRDEIYHPGQTVYDPDSFTPFIKRKCAYSNIGLTGVWHYEMRDGVISGCGIADGPYVPNPDDQPGDDCDDNNNLPGDGCSPGCWVEGDADEDGVPDAPPGEPRTAEGLPVNPDGRYDNCVSFNPERDCGDLDSDADNVLDRNDNCEEVFNPDQRDFDDDGIGDACETDDDRDGIADFEDLCPQADSVFWHRSVAGDLDNGELYWVQLDNDKDAFDRPGGDRTPGGDVCDPDDDNDGVLDCGADLICPYFDDGAANRLRERADFPGEGIPFRDGIDNDLDGRVDEEERGNEGGGGVTNLIYDRFDNDADGIIDEFDERRVAGDPPAWPGRDADGTEDNCRTIPNPDQANLDGDIWGDACDEDSDGDYVRDCGNDGLCAFDVDRRDNDRDGTVDEAGECADGCAPDTDLVDNDQDGYIDEVPFEFGGPDSPSEHSLGPLARQSSEALLAFAPWPGPDADGSEDNCPRHRNAEQTDSDGDGIGDACDDDDGDGYFLVMQDAPLPWMQGQHAIGQPADNCPDVANPSQIDTDRVEGMVTDGLGDACDDDDDDDGFPDVADNCPTVPNNQVDLDTDGLGDACDADWDGDGVLNDDDSCPFLPDPENANTDGDDQGDVCDINDDNDDHNDAQDNCRLVPNDDQLNSDGDDEGDACDADDDNDGVLDGDDNCPVDLNADQSDLDGDGIGDACEVEDIDGDTIPDDMDNCPSVSNRNQDNADDDALGNACDDDDDNDGVLDVDDACPLDAQFFVDTDGDGLGDDCGDDDDDGDEDLDSADNCELVPNPDQANLDGDGEGDACDDDDDNDGVNDGVQGNGDNCPRVANTDQRDQDGDDVGDACDKDIDGDNVNNDADNCDFVANPEQEDADKDGTGDACTDSDNDGLVDALDNCDFKPNRDQADADNDMIGDACDPDFDEDKIKLEECRANNPPLLWAKNCRGFSKKIGCSATPGESTGGGWWAALVLIALWRRRSRSNCSR